MPTRSLQYYRCPCCGKLSRGQNYGLGGTPLGHMLETATQWFVGGTGRGFRWTRRPVDTRDLPFLRELLRVLDVVRERVARYVAMLERQVRAEVLAVSMLRPAAVALADAEDVELSEREEMGMLVNEVRFA